jgi:hypothetical protein
MVKIAKVISWVVRKWTIVVSHFQWHFSFDISPVSLLYLPRYRTLFAALKINFYIQLYAGFCVIISHNPHGD